MRDGKPEEMLRRGNDGIVRTTQAKAFNRTRRQRFLDALALTCNVGRAADHAGISSGTAYYHRSRDAAFADQWRAALASGYERLEDLVLEHGGAGVALEPADADRAIGPDAPSPFDFDKAIKVLQLNRAGSAGRAGARAPKRTTREETNAALIKALTLAARRLEKTHGARDRG